VADGYSSGQESSSGSSIELISAPSGEFSATYSGPSFFSNSLTFRDNASAFLVILILISLADLPAEIVYFAIRLGLGLIAADDADHFLCIGVEPAG